MNLIEIFFIHLFQRQFFFELEILKASIARKYWPKKYFKYNFMKVQSLRIKIWLIYFSKLFSSFLWKFSKSSSKFFHILRHQSEHWECIEIIFLISYYFLEFFPILNFGISICKKKHIKSPYTIFWMNFIERAVSKEVFNIFFRTILILFVKNLRNIF